MLPLLASPYSRIACCCKWHNVHWQTATVGDGAAEEEEEEAEERRRCHISAPGIDPASGITVTKIVPYFRDNVEVNDC